MSTNPAVLVRFSPELLDRLDAERRRAGNPSRPELIRRILADQLPAGRRREVPGQLKLPAGRKGRK